MEIFLAKNSGFCFGVSKAVECAYANAGEGKYTYGPLLHNKSVLRELEDRGVKPTEDIGSLKEGDTLLLRAHGVAPKVYEELESRKINYIDCTCPCVKSIHKKIEEKFKEGYGIIITGDKNHPEVQAANAYANYNGIIVNNIDEAEKAEVFQGKYILVSQTTFQEEIFGYIARYFENVLKSDNLEIYNTICQATRKRQEEAAEIAKKVDAMLVLGDKLSSNSSKLYKISKKYCENTYFIEDITELELNIFNSFDKIGIVAGASTPPAIIKEAVIRMSELEKTNAVNNQSFEQMLDESLVTLHTGDVVKGTVIQISNGEVSVNLGYKSDGLITRSEYSEDPDADPANVIKVGDEIEVYVVRVNDGEGNVLLSRKRLEMQKGYAEIEAAFENKGVVTGKVTEVVKGGLIANVRGVRVFVPSSQIAGRFVDKLEQFVGGQFNFNILEYDRQKRRIVAGRKELAKVEEKNLKDKVFEELEVGQKVTGKVIRLVDFGAFVDLGGADGLIHISQLSWARVKKASDVLKEGDVVTATVLNIDKEKGKISLSLKDVDGNPWNNILRNYPIGSIVEGKVVRIVSFGAFIELEPGVDGLVHISQIAQKHVVKPDDELKIGEIIKVKVMEVDLETKKISLSKKEADGGLNQENDSADEQAEVSEEPRQALEEAEVTEE